MTICNWQRASGKVYIYGIIPQARSDSVSMAPVPYQLSHSHSHVTVGIASVVRLAVHV